MTQFRSLRGIQGQTTGTRRVEEFVQNLDASFDPTGLKEFLSREKAQTTTQAFELLQGIERVLQSTILSELKSAVCDAKTALAMLTGSKCIRAYPRAKDENHHVYQHHHSQRKPLAKSRSEKRPTLNVQFARNSLSQWPTCATAGANRRK
jgi:hypothetical protein